MIAIFGIFFGFLLAVLHNAYSLIFLWRYLGIFFCKMAYVTQCFFYNLYYDKGEHLKWEFDAVQMTVKTLPKLPKHMVIALGEERVSYEEITRIILWTIPTGIPVISFYDHKDELDATNLKKFFETNYEEFSVDIKWGVSFHGDDDSRENFLAKLQVNALSSKHGQRFLIDSLKDLCDKGSLQISNRAEAEAALDNIMLAKLDGSPEPDLLVISGEVYCSYGLSPWHMGFVEFSLIPSYRLLTPTNFLKILKEYGACEQRFGR